MRSGGGEGWGWGGQKGGKRRWMGGGGWGIRNGEGPAAGAEPLNYLINIVKTRWFA